MTELHRKWYSNRTSFAGLFFCAVNCGAALEQYKNGIIYYSLGNFSFGGNKNPSDKDSVVVQQLVVREANGTVRLGETKLIPFRVSSVTDRNDFKPTPYDVGTTAYKRAMSKLNGTYK